MKLIKWLGHSMLICAWFQAIGLLYALVILDWSLVGVTTTFTVLFGALGVFYTRLYNGETRQERRQRIRVLEATLLDDDRRFSCLERR